VAVQVAAGFWVAPPSDRIFSVIVVHEIMASPLLQSSDALQIGLEVRSSSVRSLCLTC
jgi:hypothetical protein